MGAGTHSDGKEESSCLWPRTTAWGLGDRERLDHPEVAGGRVGSCYPTRDKDKRGCEERMNEEESLWGEWGFFIGQRPQGFPGATWRIQDD